MECDCRRSSCGSAFTPGQSYPASSAAAASVFDIWGDAVNTAALMEAHCLPGRINVSDTVAGRVKALFELEPRGPVEAKHERRHEMFFLNRLKQEFSRDPAGRRPNESFAAEYDRLTGRAPLQILQEPSLH